MLAKKILASIPNSIRTLRRVSVSSLKKDLNFHQFRILNMTKDGMGQTQMSQNLQVSMAAISKSVDLLVKKGFLERKEGIDRRCFDLKMTREGEKSRKVVSNQVEKILNQNLKKLTKKEQADLAKGLDVLDKLMGFVNEK